MPNLRVPAQISEVGACMEFVEDTLKKYRIHGKPLHQAMLVTEESMVQLINAAPVDGTLQINIKR